VIKAGLQLLVASIVVAVAAAHIVVQVDKLDDAISSIISRHG